MPDIKKNSLTPKQFAVSQIRDHHAYVIALPGSGKTHTSVELTINLLNATESNMVLIVTFTRAAAKEINERLANSLTEEQLKRIKVSTLDSCVVNMAKQIFMSSNTKFKLLLGSKYYLTIFRITKELAIPDHDTVAEVLDYYLSTPTQPRFECELHKAIVELYQSILASMYFPTYDLKSLAKMVITKMVNKEILPYSFSHIIVDEFQDTGGVQYEWIKLHSTLG